MTAPSPETLEREKDKLYLTDYELYRYLGLDPRKAKPIIQQLQAKSNFPKKQAMFQNRYYKPAVRQFLDRFHGLIPQGDKLAG